MIERLTLVLTLVLSPVLLAVEAAAEGVPMMISYQGRLTDSSGAAVPDGDYTVTFTIWDAENDGSVLWTWGPVTGPVTNGLFSVRLGDTPAFPPGLFSADSSRYLSVVIEGGSANPQRIRLLSSPYAIHALTADTATVALSGGGSGWVDDGDVVRLTATADSVGIGTDDPEAKLHVIGNLIVAGQANIGAYNQNSGDMSFVAGENNNARADGGTISGGAHNEVADDYATIGGGYGNLADGTFSAIAGGSHNWALGTGSFIGGGDSNSVLGGYSAILGGYRNYVDGEYAAVMGGYGDTITANGSYSFLIGHGSRLNQDSTLMIDMPHIWIGRGGGGYELTSVQGVEGQVLTLNGDDGAVWMDPPAAGGGGWTDDGATVRLSTETDKVGIGTASPDLKLTLGSDGGILAVGTFGAGDVLTTSGSGVRMIWYPRKGAFRAGWATTTRWDEVNIGDYSAAFGSGNRARGERSFAVGQDCSADSSNAIAMGYFTAVSGTNGISLGSFNAVTGSNAMAFGFYAKGLAPSAISIGHYINAEADKAIAIGSGRGLSTRLVNSVPNSLGMGIKRDAPTVLLEENSLKIGFRTFWPTVTVNDTCFRVTLDAGNPQIYANGDFVGINTSNPQSILDVRGMGRFSNNENRALRVGYSVMETLHGYVYAYDDATEEWHDLYLGEGKVTIGSLYPQAKLHVQATLAYENAAYFQGTGPGTGIVVKSGAAQPVAGIFYGNVLIKSKTTSENLLELGEGLDYAEGFDVAGAEQVEPGTVLVIDEGNPGELTVASQPYDRRVAGIVAGGGGLGSGVRLGVDQFDHDVALAGRVYCKVDATYRAVRPGDLLTTSETPGYAMAVSDFTRASGAVLGKAMQALPAGQKGEILVLVTLQ